MLGAYYFGVDRIEGLFHDATGLALWVFALILFFLLDRILVVVGLLIHRALGRSAALRRRLRARRTKYPSTDGPSFLGRRWPAERTIPPAKPEGEPISPFESPELYFG